MSSHVFSICHYCPCPPKLGTTQARHFVDPASFPTKCPKYPFHGICLLLLPIETNGLDRGMCTTTRLSEFEQEAMMGIMTITTIVE